MAVLIKSYSHKKVDKSKSHGVGYIIQQVKTEGIYTTFKNCNEENYVTKFNEVESIKKGGRTYYHLKQTFAPEDKINPELAHKIGNELAKKFKHHYVVVSTHTDTDNLHNHIIFSAVNFKSKRKYTDTKEDLEELIKYNDKILKKYNLLTLEELKERKMEVKKEKISEQKIRSKGIKTDKEELVEAINHHLHSSKIRTLSDFMKALRYQHNINTFIRGSTITFVINGRKIRGSTISNEYGLDSLRKKIYGKYTYKDYIKDCILDIKSDAKNINEFFDSLQKRNITYELNSNSLNLTHDKKSVNLSTILGIGFNDLERDINQNELKKNLKVDVAKILKSADNIDDFIYKIENLDYINNTSLKDNTLLIESKNLGDFDIKKLGFGDDKNNRYSIYGIEKNLFINNLGTQIRNEISLKNFKDISQVLNFLSEKNIGFSFEKNKYYVHYKDEKIDLKRFKNPKQNILFNELKPIFSKINKAKNIEQLFDLGLTIKETNKKINGEYVKSKDLFFDDINLSYFKYRNNFLTLDGTKNIINENIINSLLSNSKSLNEFKLKLKKEGLENPFTSEEVEEKININLMKKSILKVLPKSISINILKENLKTIDIVSDGKDYIFNDLIDGNIVSFNKTFIDNKIEKNLIRSTLFDALKVTNSFDEFELFIKENHLKYEVKDSKIFINNIDVLHLNCKNKFDKNCFSFYEISERLKNNFDYANGTITSDKSMFKKHIFDFMKSSKNINEFISNLYSQPDFEIKIESDTIFFRKANTSDDFIDIRELNYKKEFFSYNNIKEMIDHRPTKSDPADRIVKFINNIISNQSRVEDNRKMSVRYQKYLRLKNEIDNKNKLKM